MDYRKFGETYYVRMDKGDEIISTILGICQKEQITSAIFRASAAVVRQQYRHSSRKRAVLKSKS